MQGVCFLSIFSCYVMLPRVQHFELIKRQTYCDALEATATIMKLDFKYDKAE